MEMKYLFIYFFLRRKEKKKTLSKWIGETLRHNVSNARQTLCAENKNILS